MKKYLITLLKKILADNISGSTDILCALHNFLKRYYREIANLPEILEYIKKKLSTFESAHKYLKELKEYQSKNKNLKYFFARYDCLFLNINENIYQNCCTTLKKFSNIITISNSKTVYEILVKLKKENPSLKVIICESRPKFEGRIAAKRLSKEKIKIELICEAMIAEAVIKCDAALIGADVILKNGNVINKTGSKTLAISCKYFNKPVFVVADKQKLSSKITFDKKKMPPEEIWRHHPENIRIHNFYFEEIERSLINNIFTD